MSIEKTKAELLSLEFDEQAAIYAGLENTKSILSDQKATSITTIFAQGAKWQHAQSAKIAKQLILAIEALEAIESGAVYLDNKPGKTPKTRARAALAEITKDVK